MLCFGSMCSCFFLCPRISQVVHSNILSLKYYCWWAHQTTTAGMINQSWNNQLQLATDTCSYISLDILIEKWMEGMLYFPNLYKKKNKSTFISFKIAPSALAFFFKRAVFGFSRGQVTWCSKADMAALPPDLMHCCLYDSRWLALMNKT